MNRRDFLKTAVAAPLLAAVPGSINAAPAADSDWSGVKWGLRSLDWYTDLRRGELAVVSGLAGSGKSMLMLSAAKYTMVQAERHRVAYYDADASLGSRIGMWHPSWQERLELTQTPFKLPAGPDEARERHGGLALLVIDCVGGPESMSLRDELVCLKEIALFLDIPIIAGVQFARPPRFNGHSVVTEEPRSYDWMRSIDLLIRCNGGAGRVLVDGPAINFTIEKNRNGEPGGNFTHKIGFNLVVSHHPL